MADRNSHTGQELIDWRASPQVGVVIVNFNRKDETMRCLDSILASTYPNLRIYLVDNGSSDDSSETIQQIYPQVVLLKNNDNLGFTGGSNVGIRHAVDSGAHFVLLLNNDAVVHPSTIAALVQAALERPNAGLLGPLVLMLEHKHTILSAGGAFAHGWRPQHRGIGQCEEGQFHDTEEVDYLSGCALLADRRLIEGIGYLDDRFFAYREDVDWSYRAKRAGFKVVFVPEAKVWHPDTIQRDAASAAVTYYITRNSLLFTQKHRLGVALLAGMSLGYARTILSWTLRPRWRDRRSQRDAMVQAICDYARGHFGKRVEQ